MESDRLGEHFNICPKCSLPIDDQKYIFSVWICDGVCMTVALHIKHEGE